MHLIACLEETFAYIDNTLNRCPKYVVLSMLYCHLPPTTFSHSLGGGARSLWLGCKILHDTVNKKFDTNALSAVGGLFFLRFLCPALLNPASVGLTIGTLPFIRLKHTPTSVLTDKIGAA